MSISHTHKYVAVLFDDGDKITHSWGDVTAVLADKKHNFIKYYDHVIAPWKGVIQTVHRVCDKDEAKWCF